jgi:hypothetical protein
MSFDRYPRHVIDRIQQRLLSDPDNQWDFYQALDSGIEYPIDRDIVPVTQNILSGCFEIVGFTVTEDPIGKPVITMTQRWPIRLSIASQNGQPFFIQVCDRAWQYARIDRLEVFEGMTKYVLKRQVQGARAIWYCTGSEIAPRL